MQQGGGVGYNFSTLRPRGTEANGAGSMASGPVSFMHIWDSMCATILSTGARRGAMMGTMRCDHPDIEAFIDAKQAEGQARTAAYARAAATARAMADKLDNTRLTFESEDAQAAAAIQSITGNA